jgi:hypothetical protein
MTYDSDKCPHCQYGTINHRMTCDGCDKIIKGEHDRWTIGAMHEDDEAHHFCSDACLGKYLAGRSYFGAHSKCPAEFGGDVNELLAALNLPLVTP